MIIFPTRNRSWALKRFIDQYQLTGATLPVCIVIDEDNTGHYQESLKEIPEHWNVLLNQKPRNMIEAMNAPIKKFPDAEFYGIVSDDCVPQTYAWDVKLAEAAKPHYVVWGDDGVWGAKRNQPEMPTQPFIGGKLARALGWICAPYTGNRHCLDFILLDFAAALGVGKSMPDVELIHHHYQNGLAPYDTTYAMQDSRKEGKEKYDTFKNSELFKNEIERVRALL